MLCLVARRRITPGHNALWLRENHATAYDRLDARDTTCRSATADYESEGRTFESFRARQS